MTVKTDQKLKNEYIVSFRNKDMLVDNIISGDKTVFIIFNRKTKKVERKESFIIGWIRYLPLKKDSNLIKTWTLLLRSDIKLYWSKENLLKGINNYIHEYVDIPDNYRIVVSYYVLLTYLYENFSEIPYLRVIWDYGSGKSRLLKVVASICYNPILTTWWTSTSALFRTINNVKWTLMLDEADFGYTGSQSEIIKLLNNGYQKGFPLMRADWEKFDVNTYHVFWPKIIWGRYEFRDKATESRCLTNIMQRSNRIDIPTWLDNEFKKKAEDFRNKLLQFRYDFFDKTKVRSSLIDWIEPRLSQIINPILSLVDDDKERNSIIESIMCKQNDIKDDRKNSLFGWILEYLKENFKWRDIISFQDIINQLDYTEWRHNITNSKLWNMLKQNGLKSLRKNYWTVLPFIENMDELNRLYKEYWII